MINRKRLAPQSAATARIYNEFKLNFLSPSLEIFNDKKCRAKREVADESAYVSGMKIIAHAGLATKVSRQQNSRIELPIFNFDKTEINE